MGNKHVKSTREEPVSFEEEQKKYIGFNDDTKVVNELLYHISNLSGSVDFCAVGHTLTDITPLAHTTGSDAQVSALPEIEKVKLLLEAISILIDFLFQGDVCQGGSASDEWTSQCTTAMQPSSFEPVSQRLVPSVANLWFRYPLPSKPSPTPLQTKATAPR